MNYLEHQVTLSHQNPLTRFCEYIDAFDLFSSGIVTRVPHDDVAQPHLDQRHRPLPFLSDRFRDRNCVDSYWWENMLSPIWRLSNEMYCILVTSNWLDLFTDLHNLIFLLEQLSVLPDLFHTSIRYVLQWAVKPRAYSYTFVHNKPLEKAWTDLLGRSSAPAVIRRLVQAPVLSSSSATNFQWPSSTEIMS